MKWNKANIKGAVIIVFIGLLSIQAVGQESYQNTPLSIEETREAVQSARRGVDFSDEYIPKPKRKSESKTSPNGSKGNGRGRSGRSSPSANPPGGVGTVPLIAKIVLVLVALGLLAFILISIFGKGSRNLGKMVYHAETEEFAKLNLEDPLHEELGKGNYRLACRILYLQMLQEMVMWRAILWRNEKTNWDYYFEAMNHGKVHATILHSITNQYDHLWYGEQEPNLDEFNHFNQLINQLKN